MSDRSYSRMEPISGEQVETDGVYSNEWGREQFLQRGETFPADLMLGSTTWKLVRLEVDALSGETEHPSLQAAADSAGEASPASLRRHHERGDK